MIWKDRAGSHMKGVWLEKGDTARRLLQTPGLDLKGLSWDSGH